MLEKLKRSIDRGIVSAGVQSTTYLETGKLRSKIENLESIISQVNTELGQTVYANWKIGADNTAHIEGICKRIRSLEQEIEGFQARINELQQERDQILHGGVSMAETGCVCTCGQRNEPDAKFCIGCGKPVEQLTEQSTLKFCTNCGAEVADDARFCTNCGASQIDGN